VITETGDTLGKLGPMTKAARGSTNFSNYTPTRHQQLTTLVTCKSNPLTQACTPHHMLSCLTRQQFSHSPPQDTMAPSRALLRRAAFAACAVQHRPTPHLVLTAYQIGNSALSIHSGPFIRATGLQTRATPPPSPIRRTYSQHSKPPDPPDYLSEGEIHVFNKIKAELDPVKLEV
jgi:hypothetical protein